MADSYVGEIRLFAGKAIAGNPPQGWVPCDGRKLAVKDEPALFSLIGVTYGGDGSIDFGIPDLRGRVPVGMGHSPVTNGSTYVLGQSGGAETVTLTTAQLPAHTHLMTATTLAGTSDSVGGNALASCAATGGYYIPAGSDDPAAISALNAVAIQNAGTTLTAPHNNMMPSLPLYYMICTQGLYPLRP